MGVQENPKNILDSKGYQRSPATDEQRTRTDRYYKRSETPIPMMMMNDQSIRITVASEMTNMSG